MYWVKVYIDIYTFFVICIFCRYVVLALVMIGMFVTLALVLLAKAC